jgi:Fungal chitosanase of glycosyl hydrolase group 75
MSELTKIGSVSGISIYSVSGHPASVLFQAGLAINADGAPTAYGPEGTVPLDYLANAGSQGNWWGIACDCFGKPYLQTVYHRAPGYYVSTTAHINPHFPAENPDRYMDSTTIPFFVLPGGKSFGAKLGDVGLLYNTKTGDNMYAIYADIGPQNKIGETSIRAANCLKINSNPKNGGTNAKIVCYLIFPGSIGKWIPPDQWFHKANTLMKQWGGLSRLETLAAQL